MLLIEDIDLLLTTQQKLIYHLFEWPDRPHAKLIVITMSKAKNLPERFKTKALSRAGLQLYNFSPYTIEQLSAILTTRLADLDLLEDIAVEYLSRKVFSITSDVRQLLALCHNAVNNARKEWLSFDDTNAPIVKVGLRHAQNAVTAAVTSFSLTTFRSKSAMEKLFLAALLQCQKKRKTTTLADLAKELALLAARTKIIPPKRKHILEICNALAMTRCIETENKDGDMMLRCISTDHDVEIIMALKEDPLTSAFF